MAKLPNPNLAKIHRNYTVQDVANLFSVHENTVRSWIKDGLQIIDNIRPLLILGSSLKQYLQTKRKRYKQKCRLFEIYCVRCRLPQIPLENMVDFEPINASTGRMIGLCPTCEGIINKYFKLAQLEQIQSKLDITMPNALKHINKSTNLLSNSAFNQ